MSKPRIYKTGRCWCLNADGYSKFLFESWARAFSFLVKRHYYQLGYEEGKRNV